MGQKDSARSGGLAVVWSVLLTLSVALHLTALGERAMSHDESIHAQLSWELSENGTYSQDPAYHGPLLYHVNAVVYSLLGDSDATARLGPALAGILLLVAIYAMRRYLGTGGALFAAVLVAISPAVLFYGRYLRNDIYMALFATLWVLGTLGYLEERRPRWLWLVTTAMALSFTAKETAFITGFSIGSFLIVWAAARIRRGVDTWRDNSALELALTMLLIALPFLAPLVHLLAGWDPLDYKSPASWRHALLAASIPVVLSLAAAWVLWRRRGRSAAETGSADPGLTVTPPGLTFVRWLALFAFFWGIQIFLFTSAFRDAPHGLVSGVIGSLGYWLGQHSVGRGSQPLTYYLILLALYEFLPLLLSLMAGLFLLRNRVGVRRRDGDTGSLQAAPWLLLWWSFTSLLGYSFAGEKMPWLTVHIVLPMALLAGWWLGRLVEGIDWSKWSWQQLWAPMFLPFLLLRSTSRLLATAPADGYDLESVARATGLYYAVALAVISLIGCGIWLRRNRGSATDGSRILGLGFLLALTVFTAQVSWRLSFRNDEQATELMVYAHATPDIKLALAEAADLARGAGLEGDLPIAYDAESAWPLSWYLRDNHRKLFIAEAPSAQLAEYPIVLAGSESRDELWPFLANDFASRDLTLLWWPLDRLTRFTLGDIARAIRDPDARRAAWRYIASRELPESEEASWPNRRGFQMYVERDLLARSWGLEADETTQLAVKEVRIEPLEFLAGPFAGKSLRMPTQIAVAPNGTRIVADAGNDRVILFSRSGSLVAVFGGDCSDAEPCEGSPLEEPWGVAVMPGDEYVIADTWNGMIRSYDGSGRLLESFGELLTDGTPPIPTDRLYGPRTIVYHPPSKSLLISDTGHHRILARDMHGEVRAIGAPGVLDGYFQEPLGLAVDPTDGTVLVADTWNRRIQRLDRDLQPIASWPVPGWRGKGAYNKPFLAIDDRGTVYASDPEASRILVFDAAGTPLGAMVSAGWRSSPRSTPLGLAIDRVQDELLISDATLGRVWVLPLWP